MHSPRYTVRVSIYCDAASPRAARPREQLWNLARHLPASGTRGKRIEAFASLAVPPVARCSCTCERSGVAPVVSIKSAKVATAHVVRFPSDEGSGRPRGRAFATDKNENPLESEGCSHRW